MKPTERNTVLTFLVTSYVKTKSNKYILFHNL